MPLHTLLFSLAKTFSAPLALLPHRTTLAPAYPGPPHHYATMLGPFIHHWWPQPHPRLWDQVDRGAEMFLELASQHQASLLRPALGLSLCSELLYLLVPSPGLVLVVLTWYSQKVTTWTSLTIPLISGLISPCP